MEYKKGVTKLGVAASGSILIERDRCTPMVIYIFMCWLNIFLMHSHQDCIYLGHGNQNTDLIDLIINPHVHVHVCCILKHQLHVYEFFFINKGKVEGLHVHVG